MFTGFGEVVDTPLQPRDVDQRLGGRSGGRSVLVLVVTPCIDGSIVGSQQCVARRTRQCPSESRAVMISRGVDGIAQSLGLVSVELVDVLERLAQRFRWSPGPFQRLTELAASKLCARLLSDRRGLRRSADTAGVQLVRDMSTRRGRCCRSFDSSPGSKNP